MAPRGLGGLKINFTLSPSSHRARLFPLPLLATVCRPPSRSARVRQHHRVHRSIVDVTNRCIATLNRMHYPSLSASMHPPPLVSSLSCSCQPDNQSSSSSFFLFPSGHDNSHAPSRDSSHAPAHSCPSLSSVPPSVTTSKAQFRLLSHIRDQCATFVSSVRLCRVTSPPAAGVSGAVAQDILSSSRGLLACSRLVIGSFTCVFLLCASSKILSLSSPGHCSPRTFVSLSPCIVVLHPLSRCQRREGSSNEARSYLSSLSHFNYTAFIFSFISP